MEREERVNVIIRSYQTANRKRKSVRAVADFKSESAAAYFRNLGRIALDP